VPWLRLLYAHPGHVTEELVRAVAESPTVCKYLDFPIEHSHEAVLKRMNRGVSRAKMEWGLEVLRREIPGVAIRTTVIVGFPGETDEEFQDLLDFLRQARFERLGAFMFSREEGSPAYAMPGQVSETVKRERFEAVMSLQKEISGEWGERRIGERIRVLVDETGEEPGLFYGRTEADAPEVDGQVILRASGALKPGDFVHVRITDALEYDLIGTADESPQ
jgi:ribosomal protein S12 methylthiotransferase